MSENITRQQAEQALALVRKQFAAECQGLEAESLPRLFEPGFHADSWVITWEGTFEFGYRAFRGGLDEEVYNLATEAGATHEQAEKLATMEKVEPPAGVWTEPLNSWSVALLPVD